MKVIDLLVRLANGEEVPKKIKYDNAIAEYDEEEKDYYAEGYSALFAYTIPKYMNDEVEIIEEDKKIPEKLKILNANDHSKEIYYENYSKEEISLDIETLQIWVNKIIDYLKSKGE